ncbi:MAG: hypothetical protein LBU73_07375 [Helicobacteraceae bacterium]|jgi:sulfur relay (sulfurtransferase) DsrC/TusE family protein|nr:hypothetical protein [Helicobacteraceae bacterium]
MNIKEQKVEIDISNPEIGGNPSVYIGKISIGENELKTLNSSIHRELYIFGASVKTGETHPKFGELKRLELMVVEKKLETNEIIYHHLAQYNHSVMYKREFDKTTYECVDMLKKKDILYLNKPPLWKASEASIPKCGEKLFRFCTQIYLPENNTTKQYLTCGATLFIFLFVKEQDELLVQVFAQDTSEQTAEDHYKLEALMGDFEKNYADIDKVEKIIKKGDKNLHDYILNHKRTNKQILELLFEYGSSKAFKNEVNKRIKQCKPC